MKLARLSLCLVFALAIPVGCGDDDSGGGGSSDEDQIKAAIATFAGGESEACDVLTDDYVKELTGTREECEKQAEQGESSDVEVTEVSVNGDTATAKGTSEGDTATVTLEKNGEEWLISGIEGE